MFAIDRELNFCLLNIFILQKLMRNACSLHGKLIYPYGPFQFYNSCKFMTLAREKIDTSVIDN